MQPYGLLEGCHYNELNMHTEIFNVYALDDYIWVHLPSWAARSKLESIHNISGQFSEDVIFTPETASQDYPRPWLKLAVSLLDMTSGQHVYKFMFRRSPRCEETETVFISYIARDNNPKTPYIYMPNRGNPTNTDTKEYNYTEEYVTDD